MPTTMMKLAVWGYNLANLWCWYTGVGVHQKNNHHFIAYHSYNFRFFLSQRFRHVYSCLQNWSKISEAFQQSMQQSIYNLVPAIKTNRADSRNQPPYLHFHRQLRVVSTHRNAHLQSIFCARWGPSSDNVLSISQLPMSEFVVRTDLNSSLIYYFALSLMGMLNENNFLQASVMDVRKSTSLEVS